MKATDINEFAIYWWKQLALMNCYLPMKATDINEFAISWWKQLTLMNLLSTDDSNCH